MAEHCPTCGQGVRVVSDRKGTSHYEAELHNEGEDWRRDWERAVRSSTEYPDAWLGPAISRATVLAADAALQKVEAERDELMCFATAQHGYSNTRPAICSRCGVECQPHHAWIWRGYVCCDDCVEKASVLAKRQWPKVVPEGARMAECLHPNPVRHEVYDYCPNCGAVRRAPKPGEHRPDDWHSCKLCRLRPALPTEVTDGS